MSVKWCKVANHSRRTPRYPAKGAPTSCDTPKPAASPCAQTKGGANDNREESKRQTDGRGGMADLVSRLEDVLFHRAE